MSSIISPRDIAARVGLNAKELERPCEKGLFPSFANYVHPWRMVFSDLLAPIDLDDVDVKCHTEQEKRLGCLRKWKARKGAEATVGAVVDSVLRSGSVDSAESMCRCLLPGAIVQKFGMTLESSFYSSLFFFYQGKTIGLRQVITWSSDIASPLTPPPTAQTHTHKGAHSIYACTHWVDRTARKVRVIQQ